MSAQSRAQSPALTRGRWAAFLFPVILAALSMVGPFTIDTAFPAFKSIEAEFGVGSAASQQLVTVYLVTFGVMSMFHGPLSDAVGRKPVILGGLTVYALASVGCALAPSMPVLLAFRALQGLSAGGSVIVSRTVVADLYDGPRAQRLMSQISMIFGLAPAAAPIVGGYILKFGDWPLIFWFLTALAVVLGVACLLAIPETHPPERRSELAFVPIIKSMAHVMRDPKFVRVALASSFGFASFFTYIGAAAIFVVDLLGQGERDFWKFFVPAIVGMIAGSFASGRAAGRISGRRLVTYGFVFAFAAAVLNTLFALIPATRGLPWAVLGPSLMAFGVMTVYPTIQLALMEMFPRARGSATSMATLLALTLNALMAGLAAPLVTDSLAHMAMAALALMTVSMLFWCWHLVGVRRDLRAAAPQDLGDQVGPQEAG